MNFQVGVILIYLIRNSQDIEVVKSQNKTTTTTSGESYSFFQKIWSKHSGLLTILILLTTCFVSTALCLISIIVVCKYHHEKMEGTTNVTKKILEDPLTDVIGIDDKEFPIKEISSAL